MEFKSRRTAASFLCTVVTSSACTRHKQVLFDPGEEAALQQPQAAAAAAATSQPGGGNRSLEGTHFPRKSHTNPPRCCGAGTDTWQGGCSVRELCLLRKGTVTNTPNKNNTTQLKEWDGTRGGESKGGNRTQNEKLQRDRRLWNGNTKSKQLVTKEENNQTATKPSTPSQ